MVRRGLAALLAACCACKETPAPPDEKPRPVVVDAGAPIAKKPPPPAPVEPLVDPALKEGAFATWDVQSLALPAGSRATFTVLGITDEAVEVLVTVKVPKGKPPPALERGLRFLMQRPPMAAQPGLIAPGRSEEHTSELQSHVNLVCRL